MFEYNDVKTKRWRTLIHFLHVDETYGEYWVRLPAWDSRICFLITKENIVPEIRESIKENLRCYGLVNLGAEDYRDLRILVNEV